MQRDVLLKFERFTIISKSFDHLSTINLQELYLPIIGMNSVFLYETLHNSFVINAFSNIEENTLIELMNKLNISIDGLENALSNLEAVGLVQSYIEGSSTNPKLIFVLKSLLNYDDFMINETLKNLLKDKLGPARFNMLNYKFNSKKIGKVAMNISKSINWLLDNNEEKKFDHNVNFKEIANKILFLSSKKIIFNEQDKNKINDFYNSYLISEDDLINILINSIKKDNDYYIVDFNSLNKEMNKYSDIVNINTTITRDAKIFYYQEDINKYQNVIKSYKEHNPENYISIITKNYVSQEMNRVIDILKIKMNFKDEIINLIVDYCLYKNFGRLEHKYIYKIGQTINNINLNNDLNKTIIYLQCVSNSIKPTYEILNITKEKKLNSDHSNNDLSIDEVWG